MIHLAYGNSQYFQRRHADVNVIGWTDAGLPQIQSNYRVNGGEATDFYIEPAAQASVPPAYPHGMRTPGCHRLRGSAGWFNLEIPIDHPQLATGWNSLDIQIIDRDAGLHRASCRFHWHPDPQGPTLDLCNLQQFSSIQELGQPVNGLFALDRTANTIRTADPVGSDCLLLIGPPGLSQEATYRVRFSSLRGVFLGLSDFFSGYLPQSPDLGIKPGYCSNGLATLDREGNAQAWLARGDCLTGREDTWSVHTPKHRTRVPIEVERWYRVRHQLLMPDSATLSRFRLWPDGAPEPHEWLCEISTAELLPKLPRNQTASFGLFQYYGSPTQWSDIQLRALDEKEVEVEFRRAQTSSQRSWKSLSPEEQKKTIRRFCDAYIQTRNPVQSSLAAGFTGEDAAAAAKKLLSQPAVRQYIQPRQIDRHYREDNRYQHPSAPRWDNVYYCCGQKSGSQWLKSLFLDPEVYRASGLKVYPYVLHGNRFASFSEPFPANTIVTHLYIGYDAYQTIPKPDSYRTFYVLRDPRDTLVSWYYSVRNSHVPVEPIPELRSKLSAMDFESGMLFMIDFLVSWEFFECQRSWVEKGSENSIVRIFRYEDLADSESRFVGDLFEYLDIRLPEAGFSDLCTRRVFSSFAGGRLKGEEDPQSHYRSGRVGDWQDRFTDRIGAHFEACTGDLVHVLGYQNHKSE